MMHCETNGAITGTHHRFCKARSTISYILQHQDIVIKDLEAGRSVDTLFLDLARAFDKGPQNLIIKRLKQVGIIGKLLHFFQNWSVQNRAKLVSVSR